MYEVKPTDEGKTNSVKGWSIWLNSALKNAPQISIVLFVYIQSGNRTSLVAQAVKRLSTMRETWVWSLGQEDSPEEGNGNPLQYYCLENPMDRGAW